MDKVVIIGAGGQGGPCTSILTREENIEEIVLADINLDLANQVKEKVESDQVTTKKVDAGKIEELKKITKDADAVINLTLPQFNAPIMKAAVQSGAHYVDTALGDPIFTQMVKNQSLELDPEFKENGLTALVGCGGSPGTTNVLARYGSDKLDRVDEIHVKLGYKTNAESEEVASAWDPGWSPETALTDYADEAPVFENGEYKFYPPFSDCEKYRFPEPVGQVVLCQHIHEETATLPRFIDKDLRKVDFKYPVDPVAGALVKMGFASSESIDVKGAKVTPLDVLMKLVHQPVETFLTEDEDTVKSHSDDPDFFIVIEIKGTKSGENTKYKLHWAPFAGDDLELYRKFGTANVLVALPAIVGAKMCMESGTQRGVIAPERLDPMDFFQMMADMGAPLKFDETLSKKVSFT